MLSDSEIFYTLLADSVLKCEMHIKKIPKYFFLVSAYIMFNLGNA